MSPLKDWFKETWSYPITTKNSKEVMRAILYPKFGLDPTKRKLYLDSEIISD
jgi:hypothetical protein